MSYRITLSLGLVLIVAGYFVLRRLLRGRIVLSLSNLTWTKVGCIYFAIGKNLNNRVPRNLSTGNRKESSVEPDVKNVYQNAIFAILIRSIEINVIRKLCMLQITAEFFEIFLSPSSKFSTASNFKRAKEPKCVNVSPKGSKSSFNLWVERVINAAVEWISSKFGIEIDYLNFIFTQIPTDLEINAYTVIEMRIESLCLYGIKSFKYFKCKKVSGKEVIETTGTLSQNEEPFSDKLQAVNFSILSVKSIKSFDISIIIDCQTAVVFSEKEVLQIPDLKIDFGWSIDDCIHKITLSSSEIKANVFSTTLLFLNSAVADITGAAFKYVDFDNSTDQAEKFKTSNNQKVNFKESDCDFKIFGFKFVSAAIQISIPAVSLNFHLPSNDEKPEYERFSRITIALDRINLFCRYDWGQVLPMLLLRLRGAKISSVSSGVIGTDNYSVVDRLMQNNLDIFPSMAGFKEEVLLCVSEGLATTCWPVDSTAPSVIAYDKAVDWTRSFISTGKPIWSHNNSSDDETSFDEHINQRRSKIDTWFTIDEEIESGTNPFISRQFKQISDNTIMAKVQSVSFDLPFEYPLSNLLWHLKYYIRTCKMASSKQYYAQIKAFEQNLLSFDGLAKYFGYALVPWRLYIFGSDGRFSIGDDKFEILLARSLRAKRATQLRISKIEGLFWKRVYQERVAKQTFSQEHDLPKKEPVPAIARSGSFFGRFKKTPSVENISLNTKPNQIPVIVDKSRPILRFSLLLEEERGLEQIRHCPDLFRKYEKMQKYCFSIYKESFMKYEQYAPEKPLLYAGAQDIHFTALWSPSFVYRAVDSDQEGNKQEENSTYGFSALLNAMDPSAMFNELELSEIELLIGAFLDARASNLCVRLRDYVVPLVSVGEVNGCGMAFIVEEAPRSEDMAVADLQIMRPKMRSWNMRPLPRDGLARLGFSIAPVKIYHSIHLRSPSSSLVTQVNPCYLSNGVGVLSGISLIHEGIFEMLNRSFDLFSRPSEDPSPQLPPWDKVRMILHGNTTSFKVNSKLRFVFLGGRDLWSCDDFLGIDVAPGLFVSLGGQEAGLFTFRIPSLCASSFNSDTLFMWHHRAIGHPFSISDKLYTCQQPDSKQERIVNQQMIDPSVQENLPNTGFNETQFKFDSALGLNARLTRFGIVLVESPPITVEIRVELTGFRGRPLLPHRKIHLIAPSSFAAVEKGGISKFSDSFHHFRTNSISLRIVVRGENCEFATLESGQTPVLHLNHYRELEEWIDKVFVRAALNFSRVKSGSIFKSGVLALVPSRGLGTVLRDIQIDVGYAGETLARMLNYYSLIEKEVRSETYGGIMVSSSGKANVRLIFRRSRRERRPIDRNSSSATFQSDIGSPDNSKDVSPANLPAWNMHFLKLDLAKSQISVVGPYKVDDSEAPTANFELVSRFVIPMSRHMISKSGSITCKLSKFTFLVKRKDLTS